MKQLIPVLAFTLLAALPCLAQDPFVVVDQQNDVPVAVENGDGLNLATITFSRKGSSKIEMDFRMQGAIPKTAKGEYCVIAYLDIDADAATGVSRGEAGTDIDVFAYKAPGDANWKCKINKTSSLLAKESFQIAKFNLSRDGFTVDVSSPLFKKAIRIRGYAETISGGKTLDRAPAEDFFTWDESGSSTNAAPATAP